ncbi:MAG: creatininase family protein [Rhodobacter sp.]|jgi:creatinine amidohydrolase|nr:creatininase family protein [Rhodobacter sp.]
MRLDRCTWYEVQDYLAGSGGIMLPCGSTEQHGPIGLIGTDAICAETIAARAAETVAALVAPTLAYTPAPFNMGFPGTMSISAGLFQSMVQELLAGLHEQGFTRIYILNGHGANLDPLNAASAHLPGGSVRIRSWWDFDAVNALRSEFYGAWEGMHATPSEVAITRADGRVIHHPDADAPPRRLTAEFIRQHAGDRHGGPQEHRAAFPDGRVGSHSALATPEHGRRLLEAAATAVAEDYRAFTGR